MTRPAAGPPAAVRDVAGAVNLLRARGLRVSAARRLLLEALYAAPRPISAEEIAGGLAGRLPPSDLASVYRNLERLEELGLVRHVHLGHGAGRYAPATSRAEDVVVCEGCGGIAELAPGALDAARAAVRLASGFEPRFGHFPVVGLCPNCRA